MSGKKAEKGIKPLVDMLNEVPYITTISSCEGHYLSGNIDKHKAEVRFCIENGYESNFDDLATLILAETAPSWSDALVEIFKKFYVLPGEKELRLQYLINIKPFERDTPAKRKRKYTDKAVERITTATRSYIKSYKIIPE